MEHFTDWKIHRAPQDFNLQIVSRNVLRQRAIFKRQGEARPD